ncbi:cation:proton antiporter [Salinarimonas rosea]|uniref:cation:proton antiporter domain-containing protein n=1 Tax=Salinarimonas rosea TaxID=552063 RepID=UPI000400CC94|nr:cation:proton antiporter [Salinarimonas rosea]
MDAYLPQAFAFLLGAILAPPLFERLGLGTAVGYLVAGVVIGPSVLAVFDDADAVMGISQLGVVLLLFVIGLDTRLSRLAAMKGDMLGLGLGQVVVAGAALGAIAWGLGLAPPAAGLVGFAFALSGTAIALQILEKRAALACPYGRRSFAALLTQDVLTVPVLALAPILLGAGATGASATGSAWGDAALALGVVAGIVLAGRYVLDHLFRIIASAGAREVMTAAALLVVLAAALAARAAGLSMALGAFLAGVMLAGSSYRHQLQADVEPFRGLLLALFFMSVGMLIDLADLVARLDLVLGLLALYLAVKIAATALVARLAGSTSREAIKIALVLSAAGEFAFVLAPLAGALGLVSGEDVGLMIALAALSMVACPPLAALGQRILAATAPRERMEEDFEGAGGSAILVGFGRFGQIASQMLLAEGVETTLIDRAPDRVRNAARFGFKVYFGDGNRLDVLRAAGVEQARLVFVCIKDPDTSLAICRRLREEYPLLAIYARAYDRTHTIALDEAGIGLSVRDTFESAVRAGREVLVELGVSPERAAVVEADVRRRDLERLEAQKLAGLEAGKDILHQKTMRPEPLRPPSRKGRALNEEARAFVEEEEGGGERPAAE